MVTLMNNNKLFDSYNQYKNIDAINFHTLWEVWNYSLNHNLHRKKEETESMILGKIIHMFLLENINLFDLVIVTPKLDKRKKEDKELYESILYQSQKEHKYIIDEETHDTIINMYDSFYSILNNYDEFSHIKEAICLGNKEYTIQYKDIIDNNVINIKSMIDCIHNNIIIDLKTTVNVSQKHFVKDIYSYGYDMQLAFYAYGLSKVYNVDIREFELYVLGIEKFPPFDMNIFKVNIKDYHLNTIENMLRKYIYQLNNPKYSGYDKKIIEL